MNAIRCVNVAARAAAALLLSATVASAQLTIELANDPNNLEIWRGATAGERAATWLDRGEVSAGDSRRDLIITAPLWAGSTGRVYVVFGGPILRGDNSLSSASVIISGAAAGDLFGTSTAAGYVTAKEFPSPTPQRDLIVGAPGANAGGGAVYLFLRGLTGGAYTPANALLTINGPAGAQIGSSLATGDLDGDGFREIFIGAPGTGDVYVVWGSAALGGTIDLSVPSAAFFRIDGAAANGVGTVLAAGDLSGHRLTPGVATYDLVIGAPSETASAGAVYVVKGRASRTFPAVLDLATEADAKFTGIDAGDKAGSALAIVLLDTDGISDLVVGAPDGDGPANGRANGGEVYVVWGSAALASRALSAADLTIFGGAAGHRAGSAIAYGNVDRNGPEDVVILAGGAGPVGEAYALVGRPRAAFGATFDLASGQIDRRIIGDPAKGALQSILVLDFTGDSYEDIVLGAPTFEQGLAFISFAPALSDTAEPNDSPNQSASAMLGGVRQSYIFGAADVDYYQFQLERQSHVRLTLDVPAAGDFMLELLDINGTVLKTSDVAGNGADETILTTLGPATYRVRISGRNGTYTQTATYTLKVSPSIFTDAFEPNNSSSAAVAIGPMALRAMVYTPEDSDWFRFRVTANGAVTINLTVPASADLELMLANSAGGEITTVNAGGAGGAEAISTTLNGPADYRIRVRAVSGDSSDTEAYTLAMTGAALETPARSSIMAGFGPHAGNGGWVAISGAKDNNFTLKNWAQLPWGSYNASGGGVRVATGDIDGDGLDEVVLGLGSGGQGYLAVLDDANNNYALIAWLTVPWGAYNSANGETFPALGDIDGDGLAEIVVGLGAGGQGFYTIFDDQVRGFANLGWRQVPWLSYTSRSDATTYPAVGDLDGDGVSEIVIGLGTGSAGWMQVAGNASTGYAHNRWIQSNWMAYNTANGTTRPAIGDVDGDGKGELIVGLGSGSDGWFQIIDDSTANFAHIKWQQVPWPAYNAASGETHIAVGNLDGDPAAEMVFGFASYPAGGNGAWLQVVDDSSTNYSNLGWKNMPWTAGAALFPAIAAMR